MNAHDLEKVLKKTTKILAGEDIDVFMEGFQPRVEYDPATKKPTRIFIPALPENTSEKLVHAIHGFIDHECSHIMFSDSDDICDATKSKLWHYIHNCIEDPRVNKAISDYYLGSAKNIRNGYNFLFNEKNADGSPSPYDKEYVDGLDLSTDEALATTQMNYSSLWFAHQMGDPLSGDKYKELDLDRVFGSLEAKMDKRWVDQLKRIRTANDVKNCSEYFEGFFSEEALDKMQPDKSDGGGEGEPGDGEGDATSSPGGAGAMEKHVPSTLEEQLAKKISNQIQYDAVKSQVGFYWTDRWDLKVDKHTIVKRKSTSRYKGIPTVQSFESEVSSITNYLTKDLRRLLEERRRRYYIGGYKSGKLNKRALYSVKLGNDRIFKKKNDVRDINAAVSLLIDMSGSMNGSKIHVAMQSAYAFAMVLDQINVPYEIFGFSTDGYGDAMKKEYEKWAATVDKSVLKKIVNIYCPEKIYAFKEFHEAFDVVSKTGMIIASESLVDMVQNEDSKHVKLALERLAHRPERVKSLFVFSDGQPAYPTTYPQNGYDNLKYYAHNAKEKYGVDVYSIGIMSNAVEHFYKEFKVVTKVQELPAALFDFLKKAI